MHPHSPPLSCFFCSLSWLGKSRQWQTGVWPVERMWRDAGRDAGRDAASSLYKSQSHLVKPIIQQTRIYLGEIGVAVVICLSSGPGFGNHWLCCCYGLNWGFPDSSVVKKKKKKFTCSAGYSGSIPGSGRSPGGGSSNPSQYSSLENPTGQRSLVGYSPNAHKESDTTEVT